MKDFTQSDIKRMAASKLVPATTPIRQITIGKLWGHAKEAETDRLGVSSIICRTDKGRAMLQAIEADMHLAPISQEQATKGNNGFANPPRKAPLARPIVLQELAQLTASQLCKR